MPGFLADQHAEATEAGIESSDFGAGLDEAGLVEDPVGRQEHLAMQVAQRPSVRPRLHVGNAVVESATSALVESHDQVGGVRLGHAHPLDQLIRGHGGLGHATLEEIA